MTSSEQFQVNQIVKGNSCGVFVILGFRTIDDTRYAQVKAVDPKDYSRAASGEIALPVQSLKPVCE